MSNCSQPFFYHLINCVLNCNGQKFFSENIDLSYSQWKRNNVVVFLLFFFVQDTVFRSLNQEPVAVPNCLHTIIFL